MPLSHEYISMCYKVILKINFIENNGTVFEKSYLNLGIEILLFWGEGGGGVSENFGQYKSK